MVKLGLHYTWLTLQTVNQGGKIEYVVKVTGTKPLTVTWYRNETEKLKSSARMKITFSQATGDAKFLVMEADAEDDGPLKVEATNAAGSDSQSAYVTVIRKLLIDLVNVISRNIIFGAIKLGARNAMVST